MAYAPPDQWKRWLCVAIVVAGGLVCVGFAAVFAAEYDAAAAVADWPTTPGEVLECHPSRVETPGVRSRAERYRIQVRFRYEVDGRRYESQRFSPAGGLADKVTADSARDRFPPGAACEVRYDPADPAQAYLTPDLPATAGLPAACLGAAGALLLGLAGWGVWSRRSAEGAG